MLLGSDSIEPAWTRGQKAAPDRRSAPPAVRLLRPRRIPGRTRIFPVRRALRLREHRSRPRPRCHRYPGATRWERPSIPLPGRRPVNHPSGALIRVTVRRTNGGSTDSCLSPYRPPVEPGTAVTLPPILFRVRHREPPDTTGNEGRDRIYVVFLIHRLC